MTDWEVIVVGAGAAGLLAATRAAERGKRTLLLEKNRRPGVKLLMSGGTRCNLTHDTDRRGIIEAFGKQGRFLHSPLAALGPKELIALVEAEGVKTKVEETGKIFPVSNKAADVLGAFTGRLLRSGCTVALEEPLLHIQHNATGFVLSTAQRQISTEKLILTTGGQSYPGCGTKGEGYAWAKDFGHTIISPRPALTPLTTNAAWSQALKGVTLPDVSARVIEPSTPHSKQRILAQRRGSFLFTHFGFSGPLPMDVSREISGHPKPSTLLLECDFAPDLSENACQEWLHEQSTLSGRKQLVNILPECIPHRLAVALCEQCGATIDQQASQLSKVHRQRLVQAIKRTLFPLSGTRGFAQAEVTAGGVALPEVDSSTMQSKLLPNLYFAGELLDLDGPIGGYNFQAAFSTGWLAGEKV